MKGYKRADGRIGIRNNVAVIYTVECARHVAEQITRCVPGAEVFGFPGCYHDPYGYKMLVELGKHPNIAGALVVRLGCESTDVDGLISEISETGKPVELLSIQAAGGTLKSIEKGKRWVEKTVHDAETTEKVEITWNELIVGVECGGSDTTSGISANPATGWAVDQLVEKGARVIFSEIPELLGSEDYLLERAANEQVREQILNGLNRARDLGNLLQTFAVSAGNEEGGLTTIEEKSLGALCKSGRKPIAGVIKNAEKPEKPGLFLLDKVGTIDSKQLTIYEENDNDGLVSLIASGAQVILFTTGRGNVIGSVVSPVVKICGNPHTSKRMTDNIDVDAGGIILGTSTIEQTGGQIVELIEQVAGGQLTQAEKLGHKEYFIPYKPTRACDVL